MFRENIFSIDESGNIYRHTENIKEAEGKDNDFFNRIGLSQETSNLITNSKLPPTGIFRYVIKRELKKNLPDTWKNIPIIDKGTHRYFSDSFKACIFSLIKEENPYCNLILKRQRLAKKNSQKRPSVYWRATLNCKRKKCPVTVQLSIDSADSKMINIVFTDDAYHDVSKTTADNISGTERKKSRVY